MRRWLKLEIVKVQEVPKLTQALAILLSLVAGFFIASFFIRLSGSTAIEAFQGMAQGAFGDRKKILESLLRASPLLFTGLATVVAFRAQIWSIGQEGQLLSGAMMAYFLYTIFGPVLSRPALLVVVVLGGILGGAILGAIAGAMKAYANVDVIISTMMLNYVVAHILSMLVYDKRYWMGVSYYPRTDPIMEQALYPTLFEGSRLHMGFILALVAALIIYWVINRTPYGYDIRALGANPVATRFQGINVRALTIVTMLLSGALAGLAGVGEVFGVHHLLSEEISPGYGYTGIIVAMVSELNPLVTILASILFGGLINGSVRLLTSIGLHTSIIYVIEACVLVSVLVGRALVKYRIRRVADVG
jgi:general nucleoside transport system permease protein